MIAPKGSGTTLRRLFLQGRGINCSFAVAQDASGRARERCLALGMNDYVTKPIYPEVLAATRARWVRRGG